MSVIVKSGGGVSVKFDDNYKGTLYIKPDKSTSKNIVSFEASADLPTEVWNVDITANGFFSLLVFSSGEFYTAIGDAEVRKYDSNGNQIASYTVTRTNGDEVATGLLKLSTGNIAIADNHYHITIVSPDLSTVITEFYVNGISLATCQPQISLDGNIYIPTSSGELHKIHNESFTTITLENTITATCCLADADGNLYITLSGKFTKLTPDLTTVWTFTEKNLPTQSMAFDNEGNIIIGSFSGNLYKFSPDGDVIWNLICGTGSIYSLFIDDGGNIIAGDAKGFVYKITPYGAICYSTQIFANNTRLGLQNNNIYAISSTGIKKLSDAGTITHKAVFNY